MRVMITEGSGLDSGKAGVLVSLSTIPTDHRGIPKLSGHYRPLDRKKELAVLLDNGRLITMFKNRATYI